MESIGYLLVKFQKWSPMDIKVPLQWTSTLKFHTGHSSLTISKDLRGHKLFCGWSSIVITNGHQIPFSSYINSNFPPLKFVVLQSLYISLFCSLNISRKLQKDSKMLQNNMLLILLIWQSFALLISTRH